MAASLMSLCSEMVFSLFWSSRHNQIDTMVSGSGVLPFPDTKGMDTAVGMVLGGEIASEPLFPADFKPWVLLTDIFSFVLKTHLFFSFADFQYKHFERSQSTGNTSRKHSMNFPTGPGHPSVV